MHADITNALRNHGVTTLKPCDDSLQEHWVGWEVEREGIVLRWGYATDDQRINVSVGPIVEVSDDIPLEHMISYVCIYCQFNLDEGDDWHWGLLVSPETPSAFSFFRANVKLKKKSIFSVKVGDSKLKIISEYAIGIEWVECLAQAFCNHTQSS